jgi:Bromodomain/PHD-finger
MTEEEYEITSNGDHPIYSKEYFCRMCCRKRCKELIDALRYEDIKSLFALPVSDRIVPNYHDIIKEPMDLQTMLDKAETDEYLNYAWVREMFELIVFNALTFNRYVRIVVYSIFSFLACCFVRQLILVCSISFFQYTDVWREAKRFYHDSLQNVFAVLGKAAPPGKYEKGIVLCFDNAMHAQKLEEERIQIDETVEHKDLVAGSAAVATFALPKLRDNPPDLSSCVPFRESKLKPLDAFYCSWMDSCFTCGSSGASDTLLFCVDCGEAFHSFCVSAPIHSMEASSVAGWRCPNCKICEISGDVPNDETRMLFCEMCDRGFSLDLVDPPLKSAPSGLWICGQCVDCRVCENKSEKDGISLKYWSQDPERCYRCGGCNGYDQEFNQNCQVCSGRLRTDDEDIVSCDKCDSKVHVLCDGRAQELLSREAVASRSQKVQKITVRIPAFRHYHIVEAFFSLI